MKTPLPPNLVRSNLGQLASRIEALALYADEISRLISDQDNDSFPELESIVNLLEQAHGEALEVLQSAKRTLLLSPSTVLVPSTQAFPAD